MKVTLAFAAAAASVALVATPASASVNVDHSTGLGWVGKGDVQLAFGWNNQAAQKYAEEVSFSVEEEAKYDVTCEWTTETGGPNGKTIYHDVTVKKTTGINAAVSYDARLKKQYTGYELLGFEGGASSEGSVPNIGDTCPMAHATAVVTGVLRTNGDVAGGLYVSWNGQEVLLPNTQVVEPVA